MRDFIKNQRILWRYFIKRILISTAISHADRIAYDYYGIIIIDVTNIHGQLIGNTFSIKVLVTE